MNAPVTVPISTRIEQFIKLRDKIKADDEEHKKKMEPARDTLKKLEAVILAHLQAAGLDNAKSPAGTAYRSTKKSATIADGEAFWNFVVANKLWDLIDKRANSTAVTDYLEQNKQLPPGINYSTMETLGVRRG
jgi:hypothetical protein